MTRRKTGGGLYLPDDDFLYFVAGKGDGDITITDQHKYTLMAADAFSEDELRARFKAGGILLFDSGIFGLASDYAREKGLSFYDALTLHPTEVPGFEKLYRTYIDTVKRHEAQMWGYIELDLGGVDVKREMRKRVEAEGLKPIPVYHPLSDGWDYFDELCKGYDRICVANVVQSSKPDRARILTALWERRRSYPKVWIHLLGYTPNELLVAYPGVNSSDSSSWIYALRYGAVSAPGSTAMTCSFSKFTHGFSYTQGAEAGATDGMRAATKFLATEAHFLQHSWNRLMNDRAAEFDDLSPWPKRYPKEPPIRRADESTPSP